MGLTWYVRYRPADPAVARSSFFFVLGPFCGQAKRSQCRAKSRPRALGRLFLQKAGGLCKVYVRAWLDRGADTSSGTLRERLQSAFGWTQEARGEEELLSMLKAFAADRSRSRMGKGEGSSEKRPGFGSQVAKVFAMQPVNLCAGLRARIVFFFFPDFSSLGADDPSCSVAVAWAALSSDLERVRGIVEADNRSIFTSVLVWKRPTRCFRALDFSRLRGVSFLACRERVKQTSQFADRAVVEGGTGIDRGK